MARPLLFATLAGSGICSIPPVYIADAAIKFAFDHVASNLTGYRTYFDIQAARGEGAVGESK